MLKKGYHLVIEGYAESLQCSDQIKAFGLSCVNYYSVLSRAYVAYFTNRVDALMAAFSRVPQRFIVKFDVDVDNPPDNVLIVKSILPQQVRCPVWLPTNIFDT